MIPDRSDKKAFAEYVASVMRGWTEGRTVECKRIADSGWWTPKDEPLWSWSLCDYRLAPEAPSVEPFTFENGPVTLKVRSRDDDQLAVAHINPDGYAVFYSSESGDWTQVSFADFDNYFEQLNGDPCGTLKAGDCPKWFKSPLGSVWRMDSELAGTYFSFDGGEQVAAWTSSELADGMDEVTPCARAEAEALIQKARAGK